MKNHDQEKTNDILPPTESVLIPEQTWTAHVSATRLTLAVRAGQFVPGSLEHQRRYIPDCPLVLRQPRAASGPPRSVKKPAVNILFALY